MRCFIILACSLVLLVHLGESLESSDSDTTSQPKYVCVPLAKTCGQAMNKCTATALKLDAPATTEDSKATATKETGYQETFQHEVDTLSEEVAVSKAMKANARTVQAANEYKDKWINIQKKSNKLIMEVGRKGRCNSYLQSLKGFDCGDKTASGERKSGCLGIVRRIGHDQKSLEPMEVYGKKEQQYCCMFGKHYPKFYFFKDDTAAIEAPVKDDTEAHTAGVLVGSTKGEIGVYEFVAVNATTVDDKTLVSYSEKFVDYEASVDALHTTSETAFESYDASRTAVAMALLSELEHEDARILSTDTDPNHVEATGPGAMLSLFLCMVFVYALGQA